MRMDRRTAGPPEPGVKWSWIDTLELVTGDIAWQHDMDAVVNAANAELRMGGGVAGAIHAGPVPGSGRSAGRFARGGEY